MNRSTIDSPDSRRQRRPARSPHASAAARAAARRDEIAQALRRLDARLETALAAFDANHGGPVSDRFRGLYISPSDARGLLRPRQRGNRSDTEGGAADALWTPTSGTLAAQLASLFNLGQFELDVLLVAFAPEFDLRYERLYAYLQDDVTRKRPTVDLVLSLLCGSDAQRLARRAAFASDGALFANDVAHLVSDPNYVHPPLLAQYVAPDEQIVRFLLGDGGLDSRLAGCCRVVRPDAALSDLLVSQETRSQLARIARGSSSPATRPCLWLHGARGAGKGEAAHALAHESGAALLAVDASRIEAAEFETLLRVALREARVREAFLYVSEAEHWLREPHSGTRLARTIRESGGAAIFGSTEPLPAAMLGVALPVAFPVPEAAQRAQCWHGALASRNVTLDEGAISVLAGRFRLMPAQIRSAVSDALLRAGAGAGTEDFLAAARAQSGHALGAVADRIEPRATWEDIVLPPDTLRQLRELCQRVEQHERVFGDWGFARKLSRGRGATALFSGGSGTGKTMAAEVIANALGLHLYRIDLARVVSKYIGETEKNLERVFAAAEGANAILFFDEADALFGKRSEVKDSHDRYANIEISYLLQKMEEYDGVAILATNLVDNLDEAFTRRLAFRVDFPFPDEGTRLRIWQRAWPQQVPLADTLDCRALAHDLKLTGGSIKNIALNAAFAAAGNGGIVEAAHVFHAVRREHQKAGRSSELALGFGEPSPQLRSGATER
jgi:SpoVK/Ycf46/Vps4 family AAA+-type ATPase